MAMRTVMAGVLAAGAAVLLGAAPAARPAAKAEGVPVTWSSRATDVTPEGGVHFHGPFGTETLTVSAKGLPAHAFLDIKVELLILRSWDGSANWGFPHQEQDGGPDGFRLGVVDGPTLLYTTFSNTPVDRAFYRVAQVQAYPSQVPGEHVPMQTGAAAKNSLGYHNPWPGKPAVFPMDSTYRLHYMIPHRGDAVALDMSGLNLQNLIDESWGVAAVRIVPVAAEQVKAPLAEEIEKAFTNSLDPVATTQAEDFQTLINGMDATVAWIEGHVKPMPVDGEAVREGLKQLAMGDAAADVREGGQPTLLALGPQIEPLLREARKTAGSELRLRIDWTLLYAEVTPINDDALRRVMLATRVLEIIGTPEAMALRKKLTEQ
jgi:hypothetical protein